MSKPGPRPVAHPVAASYQNEKIPGRWADPNECAKQAHNDLKESSAWLWDTRKEFRDRLVKHLDYWANNRLSEEGHLGMFHIIEVNNGLRAKRAAQDKAEKAAKLQVVAPVAPVEAPVPVEAVVPPAPPAVPHLDLHVTKSGAAKAMGITVTQLTRLSQSPGFPPQIDRDTLPLAREHHGPRVRCTNVYSARAIDEYYIAHRVEIERMKDEKIARLEAELEVRKAGKTGMP